MEIQNPQKPILIQDQIPKMFSMKNMHGYIHVKNQDLLNKKFFTELDLISDYVQILCQFCLDMLSYERPFKFYVGKREADQECQVVHIKLLGENFELTEQILIIQMDKIVKVDIKYFNSESKKYEILDTFWFAIHNYLNQKISNTYRIVSLKEFNSCDSYNRQQLNCLFVSRILQSIAIKIPQIQILSSDKKTVCIKMITQFDNLRFFNPYKSPTFGKNFYEAMGASQNFLKICSFLNIKSIVALKKVSRFSKNYFFLNEKIFFKTLFEYNYGKTGFEIDEMDWKKLIDKKRSQKSKQKKPNSQVFNQGIFRTH